MDRLEVTKVGGTFAQFYGSDYSMTYGCDIKNHSNKMAANVTVEVTFKDSAGRIISVKNDVIYGINAGETFHYGGEASGLYAKPVNISASAYAQEYVDTQGIKMDLAQFGNFTYRCDGAWGSLTGELHAKYQIAFQRLYLYFQFIDYRGEIIGGGSEFVDYLPGNGVRNIQYNGFVPDNPKRVESSVDMSVVDFVETLSAAIR